MTAEWTEEETAWLRKASKLFKSQPQSIVLCTTDGEITACKRGVPSDDLNQDLSGTIHGGCYLTDAHDNNGCNM